MNTDMHKFPLKTHCFSIPDFAASMPSFLQIPISIVRIRTFIHPTLARAACPEFGTFPTTASGIHPQRTQ